MWKELALGIGCLSLVSGCHKTRHDAEPASTAQLPQAQLAQGLASPEPSHPGRGAAQLQAKAEDDPSQADDPAQSDLGQRRIDFRRLEVGIYWFGTEGRYHRAQPGRTNPYYNPAKPTLLYVHGWQPQAVSLSFHESPVRPVVSGDPIDLAKPWLDQGWNVGFFLWTQFADDDIAAVERKIWDASSLTWLSADGTRRPLATALSAADILHQSYLSAMREQGHPDIRIAGHSLGGQLVTILGKRLSEDAIAGRISRTLLPQRVVLLDPILSRGSQAYLQDRSPSAVMTQYARDFIQHSGMALEIYRSSALSLLPQADAYRDLQALSAFRQVGSEQLFGAGDQAGKHGYAADFYLWSKAFARYPAAPSAPATDPALPKTCISAVSSLSDLQALMRSQLQQKSADNRTREPQDDLCTWEAKGSL